MLTYHNKISWQLQLRLITKYDFFKVKSIGNPAGIGKGTGFGLRERDRDGIGLGHYRLRAKKRVKNYYGPLLAFVAQSIFKHSKQALCLLFPRRGGHA